MRAEQTGTLAGRLRAWELRRASWTSPLYRGRAAAKPGDLVLTNNDYLALGGHPSVVAAQVTALRGQGSGPLMSGAFVGEAGPHRALEQRLAGFLRARASVLCQSGWAANVGLVGSVAQPGAPVYLDALAHASLWAGARAAGAIARPFAHNDHEHLRRLAGRHGPGLIAVDTLYSVTGDRCPLAELTEVAEHTGCDLLADESHALGVLGPRGAGLVVALGLTGRVAYRTASLAKAFAGRAGLIACDARLADYLPYHAPETVFSTTVLPHDIAGLLAVLELVRTADDRRARLAAAAERLREGLTALGYNIAPSESQIVSLRPGTEDRLSVLQAALDARGVFAAPFTPPAVAGNRAAHRLSVHAGLTDEEVSRVLDACAAIRDEVGLADWTSTRRLATAR